MRALAGLGTAVLAATAGCARAPGPAAAAPGPAAAASAASAGPATGSPAASLQPGPKHADLLDAISCSAPDACTAVGTYYLRAAGPARALALRWDGQAWQAESTPAGGRDGQFSSVSCPDAASCVAVGSPDAAWGGTRWRAAPGTTAVSSVACASAVSCQAVGVTGHGDLVAAGWDGRSWRAEVIPFPAPAGQVIAVGGTACAGISFCMMVGDVSSDPGARPSPSYRDRPLSAVWDGTRWRIVRPADPARRSELSSVSCTSPEDCTAVGSVSGQWALAERWNGRRWAAERVPSVDRTGYTALISVSCASPVSCMAVGTYDVGLNGIAEYWDGQRWTLARLPAPPGRAGWQAPSVSCPAAHRCVLAASLGGTAVAGAWNGSTWRLKPVPGPR